MTSKILFKQWKLESSDDEFTIMRIIVSGILNDEQVTVQYLLYDENDKETSTSSMSRTTAYTCTAAVNMLADGLFESKGVFPPELIGKDEHCFNYIISYLEKRNVRYEKSFLTN